MQIDDNPIPSRISSHRNASLDLFRIIIMFMIVFWHAFVYGGARIDIDLTAPNWYLSKLAMSFLVVHVNCFVLLSGYLNYRKSFSFKKFLRFWAAMCFWSVVLYIGCTFASGNALSLKELVTSCFPLTQKKYWFMTTYLLMYLLTPLLNFAVNAMDKGKLRMVVLSFFVFYVVLGSVFSWKAFAEMSESSPLFFCFLYLVGAYLAKYPPHIKIRWAWLYVGICLGTGIYQIILAKIVETYGNTFIADVLNGFVNGYTSVTSVVGSVALTMTFAGKTLPGNGKTARVLAFFSSLTLGVYLIHDHNSVRGLLWTAAGLEELQGSMLLLPAALGVSVLIFVACSLLEWGRKKLFSLCRVNAAIDKIGDAIDHHFDAEENGTIET